MFKGLNRRRLSFLSRHKQTTVLVRPKVRTKWILYSLLSFHHMTTWPQTLQTKCAGLSLQPVEVLLGIAKVFPRVTNNKKHGDLNPQPQAQSSDTLP